MVAYGNRAHFKRVHGYSVPFVTMNKRQKCVRNNRWHQAHFISLGAIFGIHLARASAQLYTVTDLGTLTDNGGQSLSGPRAINRFGQMAGINVAGGSYQGFIYGGAWTNLGTLGGTDSYAAGINSANQVAGYSSTTAGTNHAFLWTPGATNGVPGNTQMRDLETLGGSASEGYAINQSGQMTGFAQNARNDRAFRFSGGTLTDVGVLLGAALPNSYGYGINDSGHIVGTAYNASYTVAHAFFYNGSAAVDIGSLGNQGANGSAINNNDQLTGYSTTSVGFDHAFRYSAGLLTDLGTLGGNYSYGNGINNSNVIVGGAFTDAANSIYHAFICAGDSMADLNTNLDSSGAGWVLVEARAINDAGQIAGVATLAGVNHGFLLTPVQLPVITDLKIAGANIVIRFLSMNAGHYAVQAAASPTGNWTDVLTGIPGTGRTISATNNGGATFSTRFLRVRLSLP